MLVVLLPSHAFELAVALAYCALALDAALALNAALALVAAA